MPKFVKLALKLLLGLFLLGVVLGVVFLLSLDTLLRVLTEHNIRKQTGMTVAIGKFHLGLLEPVIIIKDLKIHNPADFGNTPLLVIPEIHVEYDRAALATNQIHVTLLRFNLGELDIVRNAAGRTNLFELGLSLPKQASLNQETLKKSKSLDELTQRTGMIFQGVDELRVSVGTAKYIDLADQKNNREQIIGIENTVVKNVKTPADLAGLALLVGLRSGDFFTTFVGPVGLK
jgi:uncharacterized protein involved in outer membrane biogenesis